VTRVDKSSSDGNILFREEEIPLCNQNDILEIISDL
jgi:hypothetical protein